MVIVFIRGYGTVDTLFPEGANNFRYTAVRFRFDLVMASIVKSKDAHEFVYFFFSGGNVFHRNFVPRQFQIFC